MMQSGASSADASSSTVIANEVNMQQLYTTLKEYLLLEEKFQPRLCLPTDCEDNSEVTIGSRDSSANVLRCLRVWFDLPVEVFIDAISMFDRFLTKMKVRLCHIPCITVSCMDIAIDQYFAMNRLPRTISIEDLVCVSRANCTARDICRMSVVVAEKLRPAGGAAVTAIHWARAALGALRCVEANAGLTHIVPLDDDFASQLELALCDAACVSPRTPAIVFGLLQHIIEQRIVETSRGAEPGASVPPGAYALLEFIAHLLDYCNVSQEEARSAADIAILKAPTRRRLPLVWRLSRRTLESLRPTDRLTSLLPTIEEQQGNDCQN